MGSALPDLGLVVAVSREERTEQSSWTEHRTSIRTRLAVNAPRRIRVEIYTSSHGTLARQEKLQTGMASVCKFAPRRTLSPSGARLPSAEQRQIRALELERHLHSKIPIYRQSDIRSLAHELQEAIARDEECTPNRRRHRGGRMLSAEDQRDLAGGLAGPTVPTGRSGVPLRISTSPSRTRWTPSASSPSANSRSPRLNWRTWQSPATRSRSSSVRPANSLERGDSSLKNP